MPSDTRTHKTHSAILLELQASRFFFLRATQGNTTATTGKHDLLQHSQDAGNGAGRSTAVRSEIFIQWYQRLVLLVGALAGEVARLAAGEAPAAAAAAPTATTAAAVTTATAAALGAVPGDMALFAALVACTAAAATTAVAAAAASVATVAAAAVATASVAPSAAVAAPSAVAVATATASAFAGAGAAGQRASSRSSDVGGLGAAVVAGLDGELDGVALVQAAVAVGLDGGLVHEEVLAAILRGDEAEPLADVEPLHRPLHPLRHLPPPPPKTRRPKTLAEKP